ncbi:MAG: hypothetical protein HY094_04735 [Candidatus Melainabacteria bacterium]|nr:hypothetical protein [Candidatus Melainabacteria bacterium]
MATVKDAKTIMNTSSTSLVIRFLSNTFFYLHFFMWLVLIACFGIIAEF